MTEKDFRRFLDALRNLLGVFDSFAKAQAEVGFQLAKS
jgi:hypothetical protein